MNDPFPEMEADAPTVSPAELQARLDAGDDVAILDTRAQSEYESWQIDAGSATTVNIPYFEMLDGVTEEHLEQVPDADEIITVCAKGVSSNYIATMLREEGYDAKSLDDGMRGWARLYDSVDVDLDSGTVVRQYQRPSSGCLAYMVVSGDEAAVVDPLRAFTDRYVADAEELGVEIRYVFDTHVHADHVSGVRELADATGATLVVPEAVQARGIEFETEFETVADGDEIHVGDATLDVLHTPGHTTGMTSYVVDDELATTGDTLFVNSVARPDLEEGEDGAREAAETLYETLHDRILALGGDTLVAPAHFSDSEEPRDDGAYLARIGDLEGSLDLLTVDRETFVDRVASNLPPRPANYEEIIATNQGRTQTSDDEAFELELGPNNCAAGE